MRILLYFITIIFTTGCLKNITQSDTRKEALAFVHSFYETWAKNENTQGLEEFFSEQFVTISPADSFRLAGRKNNIEGYKKFLASTDILNYKTKDEDVQIYDNGNCAVVSLYYDMLMKVGTDSVFSSGRDMLFLVKEKNKWLIVADQFSNFP